jgi:uncharacterized protein YjbI with pentapeptide repeats
MDETLSQDELNEKIDLHQKWLAEDRDGERCELDDLNVRGLDFSNANLSKAQVWDCDMSGANLSNTNLTNASLTRVTMHDTNLTGAILTGTEMIECKVDESGLRTAILNVIKADIFHILGNVPMEVPGLLRTLREGRIDGTAYVGICSCLVGTIANLRTCAYDEIPGVVPNLDSPAERWFFGILEGDTPENNVFAKITAEWLEEWLENHPATPQVN